MIVLGGLAKAYSAWVGTTRIAFLNYQAIALGQISHANDNAMIKLSEITTDDFDHLDDYDMIIVNGMGLRIDENQRKQLEEASYKVPTLTHAATNPANNIVSVDNFDADSVFFMCGIYERLCDDCFKVQSNEKKMRCAKNTRTYPCVLSK